MKKIFATVLFIGVLAINSNAQINYQRNLEGQSVNTMQEAQSGSDAPAVSQACRDLAMGMLIPSQNQSSSNNSGYYSNNSPQSSVDEIEVNGVRFKMIKVEGGTFTMGATEQGSTHQVTLSDYYIGETEVTQELWEAVMGNNPSRFTGNSRYPVEQVSWDDYQTFIQELIRLTGKNYIGETEVMQELWEAVMGNNPSRFTGNSRYPVEQVSWDDYQTFIQELIRLTGKNYIGETEVMQELWKAVMGNYPSYFTGNSRLPVEQVSWDDCQTFIQELNRLTGKDFRLPTEAEWEFVARGGNYSKGYKYSGSNSIDDVAWYRGNSGCTTHEVATCDPNELGIYDMSGNVWEWCSDWSGDYPSSSQTDPSGPADGSYRVLRGGSWYNDATYCRVSPRHRGTPDFRYCLYGFRLCSSRL